MAMKSCRVTWTIWLAFLGGAVIGLGFAESRRGVADEWGMDDMPGMYAEEEMGLPPGPCEAPMDELSPAPLAEVEPMDETDHFDTGPVWDEETVATQDAVASDETSQDLDGYRYEYPEDECEVYDEGTDDADYAEEYYYKYDYEYASSEDEFVTEEEVAEEAVDVDEYSYEPEYDYGMEYGYEAESDSEAYVWEGKDYDYESTYDETEYEYASENTYEEATEEDYSYEYGEWESDYSFDDSDYRYDSETEIADEQETFDGREWESEYADYGCDYDDEYLEEENYCEYGHDESEPTEDVETAVEEATESGYTYDYDEWEYEYGKYEHGHEGEYVNDDFETFDAVDDTMEETEADTSESAYDHGEWEYEYSEYDYGYESEYTEDSSETFDAVDDTMDETAVDDATDWECEYDEYEYDEYDYESEYIEDASETFDAVDDTMDETAVDDATDWECEYDEYDYESECVEDNSETFDAVDDATDWEYEYDYTSDGTMEETEVDEADAWESEYDYDEWVSEYGEYYDEECLEDDVETFDAAEDTVEQAEVDEADTWKSACDYDAWEYGYGHTEDCYDDSDCMDDGADVEVASDNQTQAYVGYSEAYPEEEYAYPEIMEEETQESDVEEFSYYEDLGDEYESEAEYDTAVDNASEYGYDADCDLEPEYSYDDGSESDQEWETALDGTTESEPAEAIESVEEQPYSYDYADPYEYYGYDYSPQPSEEIDQAVETSEDGDCEWMEADEPCVWESGSEYATESGLELFAWHPTELLLTPDQEVLKTLETLCAEPSGVRRATLNDYLEALGWEAIALASRFEDITGIEVLGLADDLPGAAAFLGTFRLLEQGELGTDEAVDLLRRSLQNLSLDWIEGVREITADAYQEWEAQPTTSGVDVPEWSGSASVGRPVVEVMVSLAARSLASVGGAISCVSHGFSELDWGRVAAAAIEDSAQR